jgi:protein O-GlcNAc transferase
MSLKSGVKKITGFKSMNESFEQLVHAWRLFGDNDLYRADELCDRLLHDDPKHAETLHLRALVNWRLGNRRIATALLKRAVDCQPDHPQYHNNLGVFLNELGEFDQAEPLFQKALQLSAHYHDARCNLGLAMFYKNRLKAATECFLEVLAECPNHGPACANLGMTLLAQGSVQQAAQAYSRALSIEPQHANWWGNLGAAALSSGDFSQAQYAFQNALTLDASNIDYANHLAVVLRALGKLGQSIAVLQSALSACPDHPEALGNLCIALQQTCQWDKLASKLQRLVQHTQYALQNNIRPAEQPMFNIWRSSDPEINLAVARAWSRDAEKSAWRGAKPCVHERPKVCKSYITLGYLSYDFRNHPVAHQLHPLFKLHDRSRFRVLAFSMGPDDGSIFRDTIQKDCDLFVDIEQLSTAQAAQRIQACGTDILIDLMGHSHHNRLQIPALRPAPVQVGYLGFLATTGADFIDYLIADEVVVPQHHYSACSEKMIRMPYCYQMNHSVFIPNDCRTSRKLWGLPDHGVVFCCFNSAYKINAALFGAWISILKQVPSSVLWLLRDNPLAEKQLKRSAAQMGLEGHRIIFADKIPLSDHVQRLTLADLALDTDGYNGGATTANALWAGVPLLTILGNHWVSRMSASHLMAVGLPELVVPNLNSYIRKAVELARNDDILKALRARLEQKRLTSPIFDARTFVNHLETGFEIIWDRYRNGDAPQHVTIPATRSPLSVKPKAILPLCSIEDVQ